MSGLMSEHSAVFPIRTFSKLHARDLLYYQAELAELERELEEIELEDFNTPERKELCQDWKSLSGTGISFLFAEDGITGKETSSSPQWRLMLRIREKLKEYGKQKRKF